MAHDQAADGEKQISESGDKEAENAEFLGRDPTGDKSTSPAKDSAAQLKMLQTEARASGPYDAVALHCDRSKGPWDWEGGHIA